VGELHKMPAAKTDFVIGGTEETTTGVIRLKAMEADGALRFAVLAVNDSKTKHLFDNRYGTGQSTVDGMVRATNRLLAGSTFVVCGYGWCSRGVASRAHGMGANVIVTEVDHMKALEAVMDGFRVMPIAEAARLGDFFCSITGDINVIREEHFKYMKDGAVVANSGHFNVELDIPGLARLSKSKREARPGVTEYTLKNGRRVHLLADGRLVNLACAEGHPASVMDMSFANQALAAEYMTKNAGKLEPKVIKLPDAIDYNIAALKLKALGVKIDKLTKEQEKYLASWEHGTV
ncbi:MAG: adenosylhomocysteinase, partial [Candidatus Methylomirabilis sp.]|nr:adenosylhomocysteinase [Deltaproteobacteria bacterium]